MTAADVWALVAAAFLVFAAGVLGASETAIAHVSRIRVEELARERRRGSARLSQVVADAAQKLNVILLARTVCEMLATTLVAVALMHYVVVGVGGRTLGRRHSDLVGLASAGFVLWLSRALGPLPRVLIAIGSALIPGKVARDQGFTSEAELRDMVDRAEERQVIESRERDMIHSVFELGETLAREVMVPRTDMVWIEQGKTIRQAFSLALRSGFSRIPVIGANEDDVVGVAYLKDLARKAYDAEAQSSERVTEVMRPPYFIPESKPADELLRDMQAKQVHVAIVIDEYGGTAGLVTIEDILEEIVGEIADEYDREDPRVEQLDDGRIRVNVRLPIDDIEEMFGVRFDLEDVETVGGLLAAELGRVPIPGASVTAHGLTFTAEGAKGRRKQIGTVVIGKAADNAVGLSAADPA
jgi:CBS domain containing-hemolysin-like protein